MWTGAISDSLYLEKNKIFEKQHEFALNDEVMAENGQGKYIPFTNILDKGFRCTDLAYQQGRQEILQPAFMSSDRHFSSSDTLMSLTVASVRSGNERAVRLIKQSNYLCHGLHPHASTSRLADIWAGWAFIVNFLYQPVH